MSHTISNSYLSLPTWSVKPRITNSFENLINATKNLRLMKVSKTSENRKFVLSSNLPLMFDFTIGGELIVKVKGLHKGLTITPAKFGEIPSKIMSYRGYKNARKNTRIEAVYDDRNQERLNDAFGSAKQVKIIFKQGEITVLPIFDFESQTMGSVNYQEPYKAMAVCTAGMDVMSMERNGFQCTAILETRPPEMRDLSQAINPETKETGFKHNDKTETGVLSCLLNSKHIKHVANEDIYIADFNLLSDLFDSQQFNYCSISLQCDDFSGVKANSLKDKSEQSLNSTLDMFIPMLEMIKSFKFPTLMIENVAAFASHPSCNLMVMQLRRLGYKVHMDVLNAQEHNGYTMRKRAFIFATMLDSEFSFPKPVARTNHFWNDIIAGRESEMSDKTENKAIKDAVTTGRARFVQAGADTGYTLLKSQSRLAKDTLLCDIDGRIMYPSLNQAKDMMNASNMDLSLFTEEVAMEIVGQGVCLHLHDALMEQVKLHIDQHMAMQQSSVKPELDADLEDSIENRLAQSFYPATAH